MFILVIEDEKRLVEVLEKGLKLARYSVDIASDGEEGLQKALENNYDAIVLDLILPKLDGLEVCRQIREQKIDTPIIVLSARADINDRVKGLDAGADDYMTKPFGFDELLARLRSLLRRRYKLEKTKLVVSDLVLDPSTHEVYREENLIDLSPKEYALLEYMLRNKNIALKRKELLEHIWGTEASRESNKLDVCVRYLRRKIDVPYKNKLIQTIRGVGYKIKG
jgi:DNA-binding response OmpR family regulator